MGLQILSNKFYKKIQVYTCQQKYPLKFKRNHLKTNKINKEDQAHNYLHTQNLVTKERVKEKQTQWCLKNQKLDIKEILIINYKKDAVNLNIIINKTWK